MEPTVSTQELPEFFNMFLEFITNLMMFFIHPISSFAFTSIRRFTFVLISLATVIAWFCSTTVWGWIFYYREYMTWTLMLPIFFTPEDHIPHECFLKRGGVNDPEPERLGTKGWWRYNACLGAVNGLESHGKPWIPLQLDESDRNMIIMVIMVIAGGGFIYYLIQPLINFLAVVRRFLSARIDSEADIAPSSLRPVQEQAHTSVENVEDLRERIRNSPEERDLRQQLVQRDLLIEELHKKLVSEAEYYQMLIAETKKVEAQVIDDGQGSLPNRTILEVSNKALREEIARMESALNTASDEHGKLEAQMKRLLWEGKHVNTDESLRQAYEELRARCKKSDEDVAIAERWFDKLNDQYQQSLIENKRLRDDLEKMENTHVPRGGPAIWKVADKLHDRVDQLTKQLADLGNSTTNAARNIELADANIKLQETVKKSGSLLAKANESMKQSRTDKIIAERRVNELEEQLRNLLEDLKSKIDYNDPESRNLALQTRIHNLERQPSTETHLRERNADLYGQLIALKQELLANSSVKRQNATLIEENEKLTRELRPYGDMKKQNVDLRQGVTKLQDHLARCDYIKSENMGLKNSVTALQNELSQYSEQGRAKTDLENQLVDLQIKTTNYDELARNNTELQNQVGRLEKDLADKRGEFETGHSQYWGLHQEHNNLLNQKAVLEQTIFDLQQQKAAAEQGNRNLQQRNIALEEANSSLKTQNEELEDSNFRMMEESLGQNEDYKTLKAQYETTTARLDEVELELIQAQSDLTSLQSTSDGTQ